MARLIATEVNKALTAIRKQATLCGQSRSQAELYERAEQLQHIAFELKRMAAEGGTWAQRQESA